MRTQLLDRLTIGSWHGARDSSGYYIITVAVDCEFKGNEYFPIHDGPGNKNGLFLQAVQAVIQAYQCNRNVLVHCVAGRSRSAAVCVAAIACLTQRTMSDAYNYMIERHPETRIHPSLAKYIFDDES